MSRLSRALRDSGGDAGGCSALVYSGAVPWGDRGVAVPAGTSVADAMALDPVQFSDLMLLDDYYVHPYTGEAMRSGDGCSVVRVVDGSRVPGKSVGSGFRLHQPQSDIAQLFADVAGAAGASVDTLGTLAGGAIMWAQAAIPGLTLDVGTLQHPDVSRSTLTVLTGHTGMLATQVGGCATRIVCRNTFAHALGESGNVWHKIRHTSKSAARLAEVTATLQGMVAGWSAYSESAQRLVDTRLSARDTDDLLRVLIPDPVAIDGRVPSAAKAEAKRAAIVAELSSGAGADLPSAQGSAWGLFQAVTAWSTWAGAGSADSWRSALIGDGADLSQRAYVLLSSL